MKTKSHKLYLVGTPIAESTVYFFRHKLYFHLTAFIKIKIFRKKLLDLKKILIFSQIAEDSLNISTKNPCKIDRL